MTAIALFHFYRISLGQSPFGPPGNQMYHLYSVDSYLKKITCTSTVRHSLIKSLNLFILHNKHEIR